MNIIEMLNLIRLNEKYLIHSGDIQRIDFYPESIFSLKKLQWYTGISVDDMNRGSFTKLIHTFNHSCRGESYRGLRDTIRSNYHYCPHCLGRTNAALLLWKLTDVEVCREHECYLLQHCFSCNESIKYKHLRIPSICPYCSKSLSVHKGVALDGTSSNLKHQQWNAKAWEILLNICDQVYIPPHELAQRILYILNEFNVDYNRDRICRNLQGYSINHLLQCARGTLAKDRSIHLSALLSILFLHHVEIERFLRMEISSEFLISLRKGDKFKLSEEPVCVAPWCPSYQKSGSLVRTGVNSSEKAKIKLHKYMACEDCGCEYAFAEGVIIERTYFIQAYHKISSHNLSSLTWYERENLMGLKKEKIRRVMAYFWCCQIISEEEGITTYGKIDLGKVQEFVKALDKGIAIVEIRRWPLWEQYGNYLIHRFHPDVMRAIIYKKMTMESRGMRDLKDEIIDACSDLRNKDLSITLHNVAQIMGISPTTIRKQGYSPLIEKSKQKQNEERIKELRVRVDLKTENYLQVKATEAISSVELFQVLEISYSSLKKSSPELALYINKVRKEHNAEVLLNNRMSLFRA
ncbi:hypothetical protein J2T13_000701 [Paenibacillus sp. DS2015]